MAPFEKLYLWQLATNEKPPGSSFIWNQEKTRIKFPLRFYECSEKYLPNAPSRCIALSGRRTVENVLNAEGWGKGRTCSATAKPRLYLSRFSPDGVTLTFTITNVFQVFLLLLPVDVKLQSHPGFLYMSVGWWSILWTAITPVCQPSVQSECSGRCGPSTEYQVRS